jgi:hypothetical protein
MSKPLPLLEENLDPLFEIPWDGANAPLEPMDQAKFDLTMAYSAMSLFYASKTKSLSRKQKSSALDILRPYIAKSNHHQLEDVTYNPEFPAVPALALSAVPADYLSNVISLGQSVDVISASSKSEENHPSPKEESRFPESPMSDQVLLRQAFGAALQERREGARSWILQRSFNNRCVE